jgi:hypothetical protein
MKIDESLGTIQEVFAKASPVSLPLIKAAHKFLIELAPDAVVVPRLGEKSIAYGIGVKKMSEAYCYLIPFKDYVNFGFFHGTEIDSEKILEGTGAKIRHIKIRTLEDLKNPKLKKLVLRAIKDRRAALA